MDVHKNRIPFAAIRQATTASSPRRRSTPTPDSSGYSLPFLSFASCDQRKYRIHYLFSKTLQNSTVEQEKLDFIGIFYFPFIFHLFSNTYFFSILKTFSIPMDSLAYAL